MEEELFEKRYINPERKVCMLFWLTNATFIWVEMKKGRIERMGKREIIMSTESKADIHIPQHTYPILHPA